MANIELDGANKKIKVDSGDLTLDVPGDIILDADGGDVVVADGGTNILKVTNSSSDVVLQPQVDAKDIIFKQYDGTTVATVEDNGTFNIPANKLAIGGTAVTSTAAELNILDGVTSTAAELNILDGVTATAAEINLIDGGTARGTTAIADGDGVLINDAGTMRMTNVTTLKTYIGSSVAGTESFKVVMDDNQTVSSGTFTLVNYDKEIFDNGGNYDTSNKKFTAPSTGTYQFNINLSFATDGSYGLDNVMLHLAKNGTRPIANQFSIFAPPTHTGSGSFDTGSIGCAVLINLSANDYIQCYARSIKNSNATSTNLYSDNERRSEWSGFRVT